MDGHKYETHLHTDETSPCGKVPAAEAVRIYNSAGYTGIAVTDHYFRGFFDRQLFCSWKDKIDKYLRGYRNAVSEGHKAGLDIHLGMEISFDEDPNDYLVFGFDENFLYQNKKLYRLGLKEFRELTSGTGIVTVQAHPFRVNMIPASPEMIDGIEVYNGNPRHNSSNHKALEYARDNGLRMLSGSDFHRYEDASRGGILVMDRIEPGGFAKTIIDGKILDIIANDSETNP